MDQNTQPLIPNREDNPEIDSLSVVAHELKNPLSALIGYLDLFTKEVKGSLNSEQKMLLNRVSISSKQLAALVENLLNTSRIERGVLEINTEPVDWLALVQEVIDEYSLLAQEKQIKLVFEHPADTIPTVQADKVKITEVLSNILSNAIAYTTRGGKIKVWVGAKPGEVTTGVQDTGEGIPEEALAKLFNKFYRVGAKKSEKPNGMGLGLYISKAIIEKHNGKIWAQSRPGQGSTFSFTLPEGVKKRLK